MDIATVLFTYNRSWHTGKVLEALSKNTVLPEKLYIFQDGLKKEEHRKEWEKVNELIHKVNFCPTELQVLTENIGVAKAIVSGINYVLKNHEAVIVLEDDCVPSVSFDQFMVQCLEKYEEDKRIWCIGGCTDPVELKKDQYDVYGCGRTSSSGWGTWKDRWERFSYDCSILKRLKTGEVSSQVLATWGNDCEQMLLADIAGKCDAWDIYWTLLVFENSGICVLPYESLIQNIGWDGSGVHCEVSRKYDVKVSKDVIPKFALPDRVKLRQSTKEAFVELYGSYTAINEEAALKENIIVYGMGQFFRQYEKEINDRYYIKAFIDRGQYGWYAGKKIISLDEIGQYNYSKIIVMVQNIQESINVAKALISKEIHAEQIILGHGLFGKYGERFDKISVLPDGRLLFEKGNLSIKISSKEEFVHVYEVFADQIYNYNIINEKRDIVLDIGLGTGDTALYFLNKSNVEKVYGYTVLEKDFMAAKENLENCYNVLGEVEIFEYDIDKGNIGIILDKASDYNVILKLESKGREEEILKEILEKEISGRIAIIMVRICSDEKPVVEELLKQTGFSWREFGMDDNTGLIYAYRC